MRQIIRGTVILFLVAFTLPIPLCAQRKAFWETTYKSPPIVPGDPTNVAKRIYFRMPDRVYADMVDGAEGTHFALWGTMYREGNDLHVLWASSDGGLHWKEVLKSIVKQASGDTPNPTWEFTDISYPEPNHIVVLALNRRPSQYAQIWRSTDGGTTWEERPLPKTEGYTSQGQIAMADGLHGIVVLQSSDGFFRTTDGWKTWERVMFPAIYPDDAFCPEPNVFILTGVSTSRSTDAGVTWSTSETGPFNGRRPLQCSFVDRDYGWAIATEQTGVGDRQGDLVARTTDGGMTWTEQYRGEGISDGGGLRSVNFADRMNGLIAGYVGISRTTDGGQTWIPEDLPQENPQINFVLHPTPNSGVGLSQDILTHANKTTLAAPRISQPGTLLTDWKDTVTVGWTEVEGATEYQVQMARRETSNLFFDFDASILADHRNITGTSRFFQLDYGDWFYVFRVRAMDGQDTSRWSLVQKVGTRNDPNVLATPRFLLPASEEKDVPTTVRLFWNSSAGAARYHLQVGSQDLSLPGGLLLIDTPALTDTTYLLSGLDPFTRYYCGVKGINDAGESHWSWQIFPYSFETGGISGADNERSKNDSIEVRPNPTRALSTISFPEGAELIGVFDMKGRLLPAPSQRTAQTLDGRKLLNLDLWEFPAGMYVVKTREGNRIETTRLIRLP